MTKSGRHWTALSPVRSMLCSLRYSNLFYAFLSNNLLFQILIPRIRSEIASCSERAYPSLPVASTKSLLFLDSDRAVVQFAQSRGWEVKADGRIYFDAIDGGLVEEGLEEKELSQMAIENTLGYARELETIV